MLIYNVRCSIYRDAIGINSSGGAIVTGTITIAQNEPCRLDNNMPKVKDYAPQGIETTVSYNLILRSTRQHPINVRENDYVVIVFPQWHDEYNKRLRVTGVVGSSAGMHPQDPNSFTEINLVRIIESRDNNRF